jgi:RNA methyltransferase, TrmH family
MPVRIVQSKQNPRLKELRRALAWPGRSGDGEAGAEAGIEGRNLLEEALRARLAIRTIFVAQGAESQLDGLALPAKTEVLVLPGAVLASALATETPQPIAALVEPPDWIWRDVLEPDDGRAPLILILAGVQDPGNLGTILRSAEAFGATGVVSLPGTVHAWNPKAVRASAGSVFRVPLLAASAEECFARLRAGKVTVWTTAARGAEPADRAALERPSALIIGNEGNGVPPELAARADGALTIPCAGPVESLNAAVAAGILLYEASRQRAARSAVASHPSRKDKNAATVGHPAGKQFKSPSARGAR